jgi:hypothetical protein
MAQFGSGLFDGLIDGPLDVDAIDVEEGVDCTAVDGKHHFFDFK